MALFKNRTSSHVALPDEHGLTFTFAPLEEREVSMHFYQYCIQAKQMSEPPLIMTSPMTPENLQERETIRNKRLSKG